MWQTHVGVCEPCGRYVSVGSELCQLQMINVKGWWWWYQYMMAFKLLIINTWTHSAAVLFLYNYNNIFEWQTPPQMRLSLKEKPAKEKHRTKQYHIINKATNKIWSIISVSTSSSADVCPRLYVHGTQRIHWLWEKPPAEPGSKWVAVCLDWLVWVGSEVNVFSEPLTLYVCMDGRWFF